MEGALPGNNLLKMWRKRLNSSSTTFPIVCNLCGTRMNAARSQIGKMMRCPDCESLTEVQPPKEKPQTNVIDDDPFEYRLAEGTDQPDPNQVEMVSLICLTCHELLHARAEDAGKRIKCTYCDSENAVPRPRNAKRAFVTPDISDVQMDEAPAISIPELAESADRMMEKAQEKVFERQAEEDVVPKNPFITGVVNYPLYLEAFPICLGIGIGLMVLLFITQMLTGIMSTRSMMWIGGVFITNLLSMSAIAFLLMISPSLLTIIEYTAVGRDKVDQFPKSELMERGFAALVFVLSFAFGSVPGMVVAWLFQGLGVPMWVGLIATPFFFPIVLTSILEANSLFGVFNRVILRSLSYAPISWFQFWSVTYLLMIGIAAFTFLLSRFGTNVAIVAGSLCVGVFVVYYFRFLGRLAWVIVDKAPLEEDDDDAE